MNELNEQALAMHAAEDLRLAQSMPSTLPKGAKEPQGALFEPPNFPEHDLFTLTQLPATAETTPTSTPDDGAFATVWGPFQLEDWVIDPATGIATAHDPNTGHPLILCILQQTPDPQGRGSILEVVQNDVDEPPVHFLLATIPDNTVDIDL